MSASRSSGSGGVDVQTLVITAVASACAAYVTSEIWAPGTLASAAITPVIVALVKEGLAKPADVVTRAVPVRGVVRGASRAAPPEPYDPVQPFHPADERVAQHGEIPGASIAVRRHAWKAAIVTGLLGFLVAAVIITVPELVAGKAATGGDRHTTLLGGGKKSAAPTSTTTTTTPSQTETAPPASTVTVAPVQTTTVPPAETTTVPPAQTTPVPPPVETTPASPPGAQPVP